MGNKLTKEINKLKYLNQYERGNTLMENRVILTESVGTILFKRIFTKRLGGTIIKSGVKVAEKMNLKNLNKYVSEEFSDVLNSKIKSAQKNAGLTQFGPDVVTIGGKVADIDMVLSILRRVLRDGDSRALSYVERNVLHDSLAMVDDDFFKALKKEVSGLDDFKYLMDPGLRRGVKERILDDPASKLRGYSDEFLEKMGVPVSVIRKGTKDKVADTTKNLVKGTDDALQWVSTKLGPIFKNSVRRFSNLTKRIKFNKKAWSYFVFDVAASVALFPLWMKITVLKALALRLSSLALSVFAKRKLPKELAEKGGKWFGTSTKSKGLFQDLITITSKEGKDVAGTTNKIFNFYGRLSNFILGSRTFNYGVAAFIWIGYLIKDFPIVGQWFTTAKDYLMGILRGETLGPCGPMALTSGYADLFAPRGEEGILNKLGISYDTKQIRLDAIELYAALSPECFKSEEEFAEADKVVETWLKNSPSRLYMSLVAREYKKLTEGDPDSILPNFRGLCADQYFVKTSLYKDIMNYSKPENWSRDVIKSWHMEIQRLPLNEYASTLCSKDLIEKDFDQMMIEVNDYLWEPNARVPNFIQDIVDGMSEEELLKAGEGLLGQPVIAQSISKELQDIKDELALMGVEFDSNGNVEVDMKDLLKIQLKLLNSPGMDQLVYIIPKGDEFVGVEGDFTTRRELSEPEGGYTPMKMLISVDPPIQDRLNYAIGSVPQYVTASDNSRVINVNALDKDELCDGNNQQIGYLCYYAEFRDGDEDYRQYLPNDPIEDLNGVSKGLRDRVPAGNAKEIGEQNPILWAIAAYEKHNSVASENRRRYPDFRSYDVYPEFTRTQKLNEGILNKKQYKIGLGTLLNK